MGRELVRQLAAEGCQRGHVRRLRRDHGRDQRALPTRTAARRACGSPRTSPTCPTRRRCMRFRDEVAARARHRPHPPAVQQRRHRRRRQLRHRRPRGVGPDVRRSAGAASTTARARSCRCCWRPTRATSSTPAASTASGPALGPGMSAHRLQRGEVRGEGLHRGADHRPALTRAAHQVLGGHARPHRHVDRHQLPQAFIRRRGRADREEMARARSAWPAPAWTPHGVSDERRSRLAPSRRASDSGTMAPTTAAAGGHDHPRRRQGRSLAHPGRRRRHPSGPPGARRP